MTSRNPISWTLDPPELLLAANGVKRPSTLTSFESSAMSTAREKNGGLRPPGHIAPHSMAG
jgi:hypothetical protein